MEDEIIRLLKEIRTVLVWVAVIQLFAVLVIVSSIKFLADRLAG